MLESIYADELPPGVTPEELKRWFDDYDEEAADKEGRPARVQPAYRASQAIRVSMKGFKTGAYISADFGFLKKRHRDCPRRAIFREGYAPAQSVKWGLSPAQRAG